MRPALVGLLLCATAVRLAALSLYVSPSGNDQNPGSADAPFATLTRARDAIRDLKSGAELPAGGVTVWLAGGTYDQSRTVSFERRDSGTADRPIVYSALPGQLVRITGAICLDPSWFSRVDSASPVWPRLDPSAHGNVYSVNLREHGTTDFGALKPGGFHIHSVAAMELFINGRPMTLARWPNRDQRLLRTASAPSNRRITYLGSRPDRWSQARDAWLHGLWSTAWADFHVEVSSINTATKAIDFVDAPAQFGTAANHPYYAYNLLEEIDEPGEYYLDRSAGVLYLWPPGPLANAVIQASVLEDCLVELSQTEHITLRNLTLEATRGPLLHIEQGDSNRVEGCLLRNCGEYAAQVTGSNNGLDQCEVADCGEDGVLLGGGSRSTLTPGNNFVTNCRIRRIARINWTYHPAINFTGGCGNLAAHNLIEDLPHAAVLFSGNNHVIEYNEIRRVCQLTSDSGAIYSGRDWSYRGNVIRFNFIHHIHSDMEGQGTQGVYLDDCMSSAQILSNVFYRIDGGAIFCGGGRDNIMENNIIAFCRIGHYNGDFARGFIDDRPGSSWNLLERLSADGIHYREEPWASAFPSCAAIPDSWQQVQRGLWRNPEHCVFSHNAGWSNDTWMHETNFSRTGVFSVYTSIAGNDPSQEALFGDDASWDRNTRPAELRPPVSGFIAIPFASIGPAIAARAGLAPPAPALQKLAVSDSRIDLHWSDEGSLPWQRGTGARLELQDGSDGSWHILRSFGPDVDFASVGGLAPESAHAFRVEAFNAAGSARSGVLLVSTRPAPLVAGAGTRFEAASPLEVIRDVGRSGAVAAVAAPMVIGKCVSLFDPGDSIRIPFTAPSAGSYRISVRVRSGAANLPIGTEFWPNGYRFILDGGEIQLKGDPATVSPLSQSFGPTYWGTMRSDPVDLAAGPHALQVTSAAKWAAADYLEIAPMGPHAPGAPRL